MALSVEQKAEMQAMALTESKHLSVEDLEEALEAMVVCRGVLEALLEDKKKEREE
jgi:hypothetical protein